jgi:DNA polymerase III epsilon subunit-like protein
MIVIDGEFSGLDHKSQGLVSLGAVDLYNPEKQFYGECRLEPEMTYVEEALKVNGFSVEEIYDPEKQSIKEMITKFNAWLKTCTTPQVLIGHNPKSDIDFLVESYKIAGIKYPLGHRSMDTHTIIMMKHLLLGQDILQEKGKYKINLDEGLKYVGIPD